MNICVAGIMRKYIVVLQYYAFEKKEAVNTTQNTHKEDLRIISHT